MLSKISQKSQKLPNTYCRTAHRLLFTLSGRRLASNISSVSRPVTASSHRPPHALTHPAVVLPQVSCLWRVDSPYLDPPVSNDTWPTYFRTAPDRTTLSLVPGALAGGYTYTFTLACTDLSSRGVGMATLDVLMNRPPRGGYVVASVEAGGVVQAGFDAVTLTAIGW